MYCKWPRDDRRSARFFATLQLGPRNIGNERFCSLTSGEAVRRLWRGLLITGCLTQGVIAQQPLTWQQIRDRFEATNPTLQAARIGVDESRAQEVTAYLRPNPSFTFTLDQLQAFTPNPYQPFTSALPLYSPSYLHERRHKRELRLESAQKATQVAELQLADQK